MCMPRDWHLPRSPNLRRLLRIERSGAAKPDRLVMRVVATIYIATILYNADAADDVGDVEFEQV